MSVVRFLRKGVFRLACFFVGKLFDFNQAYAGRFLIEVWADLFTDRIAPWRLKLWAYSKGFTGREAVLYGLNKDNYKNFLSSVVYYKKRSFKNGSYHQLFDDKLATYLILKPYERWLPKHYFAVKNNRWIDLNGPASTKDVIFHSIITMLREGQKLALKRVDGARGEGFYKIEKIDSDDKYFVNKELLDEHSLLQFLGKLEDYIITEFLEPHEILRAIFPHAINSVRLISVFDDCDGPQITGAFIRFGTHRSGVIDGVVAGGVACGVDIKNGTIFTPTIYQSFKPVIIQNHPDTGAKIEGQVPDWAEVCSMAKEISSYLRMTPYLTFDIGITAEGPKILEINSHGAIRFFQRFHPFLGNPYSKALFLSQ